MGGILPVQPLNHQLAPGLGFRCQKSQLQQQLVYHAALVQEHQVEHQAQGGGGNDNGEKVNGAKYLRAHPDGIHQQGQNQGDAHLEHHRAHGQQHRVFQRRAQVRVRQHAAVVFVPGGIEPLGGTSQSADV